MISSIICRLVILLFATLYPAYNSYKALRTKKVKEYVKWMIYWIVFALFRCAESFTDVFLSWFPFYYEIKITLVIWLFSPATKGSIILYRKFVHPMLSSHEQEIDEYISKAKEQGYKQVLDLGSQSMCTIMQAALKTMNLHPSLIPSASDISVTYKQDELDTYSDYDMEIVDRKFSEDDGGYCEVIRPVVKMSSNSKLTTKVEARSKSGSRMPVRKQD